MPIKAKKALRHMHDFLVLYMVGLPCNTRIQVFVFQPKKFQKYRICAIFVCMYVSACTKKIASRLSHKPIYSTNTSCGKLNKSTKHSMVQNLSKNFQ